MFFPQPWALIYVHVEGTYGLYSCTHPHSFHHPLGIDISVGSQKHLRGLLSSSLSQTHILHVRDYLIHQIG
jgi:hypothetical protein